MEQNRKNAQLKELKLKQDFQEKKIRLQVREMTIKSDEWHNRMMRKMYKHSPRYIGIRRKFEELDPYNVLDQFEAPPSEE